MLFTFPSRYWFTIGRAVVLRLGRWSSQIPTGFLVSCGTQVPSRATSDFAYGPITLYRRTFQFVSAILDGPILRVLQPQRDESHWFSLFPVRSPLLRESLLISFPPVTEMFHFTGLASTRLCIQREISGRTAEVSPFGHLRIKGCLAPPRSLSQLATSFIASVRQGIHHLPLVA